MTSNTRHYSWILVLTSLMFFSDLVFSADTKPQRKSPKIVLEELVKDPDLSREYQMTQMTHLRTRIDMNMWSYFNTNPLLKAAMNDLKGLALEAVQGGEDEGNLGMTRVNTDVAPELYKAFRKAGHILGYSDEVLDKAILYRAMGPVNAYTFSAFKGLSRMVVFDSLDDKADEVEMLSVILHEYGHILSEHVLMGIQNMVMMMQVNRHFLGTSGTGEDQFEELIRIENSNKPQYIKDFWLQLFKVTEYAQHDGGLKTHGPTTLNARTLKTRRNVLKIFFNMASALEGIKARAPSEANAYVADYLKMIVTNLSTMEVAPERLQFYLTLLENINTPEALTTTPFGSTSPALRVELQKKLIEHSQLLMADFGREFEASCDNFANSGVGLKAAVVTLKFSGLDMNSKRMNKLQKYLKSADKQLADFYISHSELETDSTVGETGNHPASMIRAMLHRYNARSIDLVAMRNPFLRLVVFHDRLNLSIAQISEANIQLWQQLEEIKKSPLGQTPQGTMIIDSVKKGIKEQELKVAKLTAASGNLDIAITEMITSLPEDLAKLNAANYEANKEAWWYEGIYESSVVSKNPLNPRLLNLADYYLARRQVGLKLADEIENLIKTSTDKDEITQLTETMKAIREQALVTPRLALLLNMRMKMNPKEASYMKELVNPNSTQIGIRNLRQDLAIYSKAKDRWSRIELDPTIRPRSSNVKGLYPNKPETLPPTPGGAEAIKSIKSGVIMGTACDYLKRM